MPSYLKGDGRHIEEAFSAVPSVESGQFTVCWDRQETLFPRWIIYLCIYTVKGVSCFLYSHTGSPEPNGEYSSDWLTLSYMPNLKL